MPTLKFCPWLTPRNAIAAHKNIKTAVTIRFIGQTSAVGDSKGSPIVPGPHGQIQEKKSSLTSPGKRMYSQVSNDYRLMKYLIGAVLLTHFCWLHLAHANPYLAKPGDAPATVRVAACAITGGFIHLYTPR
jgi:hypothetical protein